MTTRFKPETQESWFAANNTSVSYQQFEYLFDDIGNRKLTKAGGDASGANLRPANYLANPLNQYVFRTVPGEADIIGQARTNATVTVNLQPTARKGEYCHRPLALNNRAGAVWQVVTNLAVLNNGTNADILSSNVGSIFLPQTPEVYAYDADGNLTRDGHWTLTWNGENRLVALETIPAAVATGVPKEKLEFTYDHQGRRVQKRVYAWDQGSGVWVLGEDSRFLYDGWNLIAVVDSQSFLLKSFTWGLDLSGSLQGAGGVGGLLAVFDPSTINSRPSTHFAAFDGNGNVMALVDAADGTENARYEYGPFGELLRATGPMAKANPFRFSTKYQDEETGWNYYGHRFLDANMGGWLNRDPIAERGGANVYGFVMNNGIDGNDVLGLWRIKRDGKARAMAYADTGDTVRMLARIIQLNPSEWRRWLRFENVNTPNVDLDTPLTCFNSFSVPNTAYIDVAAYTPYALRFWLWGYRSQLQSIWQRAGFKVEYTYYLLNKTLVEAHMGDTDLYKYAYLGHGAAGQVTAIAREILEDGKYTPFGIAEMQLIACESDWAKDTWKRNVAGKGLLITVEGELTVFKRDFRYHNGEEK